MPAIYFTSAPDFGVPLAIEGQVSRYVHAMTGLCVGAFHTVVNLEIVATS